MKRKHYVYAAYLAVVSSLPILKGNVPFQEILKAIIAKIAEIISIKTLDNINDKLHTHKQATDSLVTQLKAFTSKSFQLQDREDEIGRAENSTYQVAYLTNQLVSKATNRRGPAFQFYLEDIERYIKGQKFSFKQKIQENKIINFREFLSNANEKAVGRIWLAVDFCFLNSHWYLDAEDFKVIDLIKKSTELIFKGCNVYDDIADLEEDLKNQILNSVVLLALDTGLCERSDLEQDPIILKSKLERVGAITSALRLGDLMFIKGLEKLEHAKYYTSRIDVEGLKFGTYVLRLFSIRKWLLRQLNPWEFLDVFSPSISDEIMRYEQYI
jgi:hypothetical protein